MRYVDVSDFKPVPDNQEVWTDADRDESVILEILERVEAANDASWFFNDLAAGGEYTMYCSMEMYSSTLLVYQCTSVPAQRS